MSSKSDLKVWRVRAKADQRFRAGHPWVYSNELQESPKGIEPGTPVELQDAGGKFLARGYGNPHSLIAFRALSRNPEIAAPHAPEQITQALISAGKLREKVGLRDFSHRLCFGEADLLPGLIIDRYKIGQKNSEAEQVFVAQLHTAGMDRLQPALLDILKSYTAATGEKWEKTSVILDNGIGARKLEGIAIEEARILKATSANLEQAEIRVVPAQRVAEKPGASVVFKTNLVGGQKTGFFLDQSSNIELAISRLSQLKSDKPLKIIDLCCYVGQWGTQLTRALKRQGLSLEVTAVDASAKALEDAKKNIEREGAVCKTLKADVLTGLKDLEAQSYDIVICDPPALIKARKDIPTGTHAYLQLNTEVFRIVKRGGFVVSCSCSGLLEEEAFEKMLSKASYRNQAPVRWIARGTQAPDHPTRIEFPEGHYLKMRMGYVG